MILESPGLTFIPAVSFAENVKFIVLVRPSAMLRALLVVLRPFLSLKAARKLHKVMKNILPPSGFVPRSHASPEGK
jgi:hypothetical protein